MAADLLSVLSRVARAMESVVPELSLTPEIGAAVWLDDDSPDDEGLSVTSSTNGEWVKTLGFEIRYRGVWLGSFGHASGGSEPEQVRAVALELMSQVQDVVAEATTEPWPLVVVNNKKDMAMADSAVEGDELHLWFGDRHLPALRLPSVRLI